MPAEQAIQVLLVEDSPTDVLLAQEALEDSRQFHLVHTERLSKAMDLLGANGFQVVLLDLGLPDSQGLDTLVNLRRRNPLIAVIVMTGRDDEDLALRAVHEGAQDYIVKNQVDARSLARAINYAIERNEAKQYLRESEERYRRVIETATEGIWALDAQDRTTLVNERMAQMLGYSVDEMVGQPLLALLHERDRESAAAHLKRHREGTSELFDFQLHRRDGTELWVMISASPFFDEHGRYTGALAMITDVSERRKLEEQVRQAQKMEAIGQLAGGVAHDFNNLITIISGYSELLLSDVRLAESTKSALKLIHSAGERAASLTRQLLAFSRKQVVEPKILDVNAVISDLEKMLRRLIGEDVTLTTALEPLLGKVRADAGQVEQVIMNLVVNARDAMPQGGKLTIETAIVELDDSYVRAHNGVKPGRYIMLAVSDTGIGMDKATEARIFEPFFTTKGVGKGTGLGLATVYGIVQQSGGNIYVYSELGKGTTFKVYFPIAEEALTRAEQQGGSPPESRGTETILLVEDDDGVRALTKLVLQMQGYTVLEASRGAEAVKLAKASASPIQLLVTDVIMPEMSGRQVAEELVQIHPKVKVLYLSGYTDDAVVRHGILQEKVAFLQKPFAFDALARKVREVLDK